jgi:hypothetical protein
MKTWEEILSQLHTFCANSISPLLIGIFELPERLFHTLFNRAVEKCHTRLTFRASCRDRMARKLRRRSHS